MRREVVRWAEGREFGGVVNVESRDASDREGSTGFELGLDWDRLLRGPAAGKPSKLQLAATENRNGGPPTECPLLPHNSGR